MANGLYGQTIPANINANDVEILYTYSETRNTVSGQSTAWKKLDSNILRSQIRDTSDGITPDSVLEGMYKLNLPVSVFNKAGFYSLYIKPREFRAEIKDISTLSDYEDVNGLVIDISSIQDPYDRALLSTPDGLVGYRIIYLDNNGERRDYVRIVTSNRRCEPVIKQVANSGGKNTRYRYNNSSNLVFVTVTPSMATSYSPTVVPFIGSLNEKNILLVNTKFTPQFLDIEVVDHDIETVTTMLEGSQGYNQENGNVTTFDKNGNIYHQAQMYTEKNTYTGEPTRKVKLAKDNNIDYTETLD